jgi:addiction module HigA family antidote
MTHNPLTAALPPSHPGGILRRVVLPSLDISKSDLARRLRISRQTLHGILAEKAPMTIPVALRLGKVCGNGPELWLNLQQAHDLAAAEREMAEELASIVTLQTIAA